MILWIILGVALVALVTLVVILNRRGTHELDGDDSWRDRGLPPGTRATHPDPYDHGF